MATPSQLRASTPQGKEALDFLNRYKAAQASVPPAQGSPGFAGPPRPMPPAPQGTISRVAGATANAARTTAGVVGRGLTAVGTVPLAAGAAMLAYPSKLGDGTLSSPEAQQAIAENEKINRAKDPRIAAEPTSGFVNSLKVPAQVSPPSSPGVTTLPDNPAITRGVTPAGAGMERRVYTSPEGAAMGAVPVGRGQGGYVGATTNEEAGRNLQSRFQQDAAASQIAASYDRSTEALRDLRAERMGIPRSQLDIREGRAEDNSPTLPTRPSDEELNRDRNNFINQFAPKSDAWGRAKRQGQANMINAYQAWTQDQQNRQRPVAQAPTVNPLDAQRFLLDQQKFGWQQGVDKGRLTLDQAKVQNEAATTSLAQKKQDLEAKSAFTEKFSIGDENAPNDELAAGAWEISKATGGVVSPEIVAGYMQRSGYDWKNGPPKNMNEYFKSIAAQITKDYQGQ